MSTINQQPISLGQQVWKYENGGEDVSMAFKRITGLDCFTSNVTCREPSDDGEFIQFKNGFVIWIPNGGPDSEIFAPLIDDALPEGFVDPLPPDDTTDESLTAMLRTFAALEKQRRDLEQQLASVKQQIDSIESPLAEQMGLNGMQNASVDGLTIYLKRTPFVSKAKGIETEQVCDVLEAVGLGYMVGESYNANSLKSKVKEYREQWAALTDEQRAEIAEDHTADGVPKKLAALLSIGENITVETRAK